MSQPLFVLGKQRSGTTWLANQLSQHSQIAAVRDDHHGGVHESAYFSHVAGRYGDLARRTNFVEFTEVMAVSDTLRIAAVDKAFLYSLWPSTYEYIFQAVMGEVARRKEARYWLDKTPEHTLMIHRLAAIYPDAKFIAIVRDAHDVMRSNVGRYRRSGWRRQFGLFYGTLNLVHYTKEIAQYARRSRRIKVIRFEDMRSQPEKTFRELVTFLELDFEAALLKEAYVPNTTFWAEREGQRHKVLSQREKRLISAALKVGNYLPNWSFRIARRLMGSDNEKPLPRWFFSMYPPVFEEQPGGRVVKQVAMEKQLTGGPKE